MVILVIRGDKLKPKQIGPYLEVIEQNFIKLVKMSQFHLYKQFFSIPMSDQSISVDINIIHPEVSKELSKSVASCGAFDVKVNGTAASPRIPCIRRLQHNWSASLFFSVH